MKKAYVFGRGNYWNKYRKEIIKEYDIIGFIDNAVKNEIIDFNENIVCMPPNELEITTECFIIITSSFFIEMYKQLKCIGIQDDKIIFYVGYDIKAMDGELYFHSNHDGYILFTNVEELKALLRKNEVDTNETVRIIKKIKYKPVSIDGSLYGTPVDRYYIEKFIGKNSSCIQGIVMEVQDDRYTKRFWNPKILKSIICHVEGWDGARKVNFENGEGIEKESVDCLICTQTLQYIFYVEQAMSNIISMLKKGGTVLITVPGIKAISEFHDKNWGEFWSFTEKSVKNICEKLMGCQYQIECYGNVKVATAFLYGISAEHLTKEELDYKDERFPFIIGAKITKDIE